MNLKIKHVDYSLAEATVNYSDQTTYKVGRIILYNIGF